MTDTAIPLDVLKARLAQIQAAKAPVAPPAGTVFTDEDTGAGLVSTVTPPPPKRQPAPPPAPPPVGTVVTDDSMGQSTVTAPPSPPAPPGPAIPLEALYARLGQIKQEKATDWLSKESETVAGRMAEMPVEVIPIHKFMPEFGTEEEWRGTKAAYKGRGVPSASWQVGAVEIATNRAAAKLKEEFGIEMSEEDKASYQQALHAQYQKIRLRNAVKERRAEGGQTTRSYLADRAPFVGLAKAGFSLEAAKQIEDKLDKGEALSDGQLRTIANAVVEEEDYAQRSGLRKVGDAVAYAPGMLLEMAAAAAATGGPGAVVAGGARKGVGIALRRMLAKMSESAAKRLVIKGAEVGTEALVKGGITAAATPSVTGMKAVERMKPQIGVQDGEAVVVRRGEGAATAIPKAVFEGAVDLAVFQGINSVIGKAIPGASLSDSAKRVAAQIAVDPIQNQAVSAIKSGISEVLPKWAELETGYGTLGHIWRGETDKAIQEATMSMVTSAAFALSQEPGERGRARAQAIMDAGAASLAKSKKSGLTPEAAAKRLMEEVQRYQAEQFKDQSPDAPRVPPSDIPLVPTTDQRLNKQDRDAISPNAHWAGRPLPQDGPGVNPGGMEMPAREQGPLPTEALRMPTDARYEQPLPAERQPVNPADERAKAEARYLKQGLKPESAKAKALADWPVVDGEAPRTAPAPQTDPGATVRPSSAPEGQPEPGRGVQEPVVKQSLTPQPPIQATPESKPAQTGAAAAPVDAPVRAGPAPVDAAPMTAGDPRSPDPTQPLRPVDPASQPGPGSMPLTKSGREAMQRAADAGSIPAKERLKADDALIAKLSEPPERRMDAATRKKVADMSPEERAQALLTSNLVNLPNRRAYDEAGPAKVVGMSDADGLKALNDKYGYAAGDAMLRAKADALREAGLDAYHEKGDEFLYRGESEADVKSKIERARSILRDKIIVVDMADGTQKRFRGADFSYGVGNEQSAAESGLKSHKAEREARGERSRGELRGITELGPSAGQENQRGAARGNNGATEAVRQEVAPKSEAPPKGEQTRLQSVLSMFEQQRAAAQAELDSAFPSGRPEGKIGRGYDDRKAQVEKYDRQIAEVKADLEALDGASKVEPITPKEVADANRELEQQGKRQGVRVAGLTPEEVKGVGEQSKAEGTQSGVRSADEAASRDRQAIIDAATEQFHEDIATGVMTIAEAKGTYAPIFEQLGVEMPKPRKRGKGTPHQTEKGLIEKPTGEKTPDVVENAEVIKDVLAKIDLSDAERRVADAVLNGDVTIRDLKKQGVKSPAYLGEQVVKKIKAHLAELHPELSEHVGGAKTLEQLKKAMMDVGASAEARSEADRAALLEQQRVAWGGLPVWVDRTRPDKIPDAVKADNPEVEARLSAAHGMKKDGILSKIKERLGQSWRNLTRAQKHLPNNEEFSGANEGIRLLKVIPSAASDEANRTIGAIIDPLGPQQLALLERNLIAENQLMALSRGEPLRFGFKDKAEVEAYLGKLQKLIAATPEVKKALMDRESIRREVVSEAVDLGILDKQHLDNPAYYHQAISSLMGTGKYAGGNKPLRKERAFQKARVEGSELGEYLDYNTSFIEAEGRWMTELQMEVRKEKLIRQFIQPYDILPQVKRDAYREMAGDVAKDWADAKVDAAIASQGVDWKKALKNHPDYDVWVPEPNKTTDPVATHSGDHLARVLMAESGMSPKAIEEALNLGRGREMVLPKELVAQLQDSLKAPEPPEGVRALAQGAMKWWKGWQLVSPKRIVGYMLRNLSGDIDPLVAAEPKALKHVPKAAAELHRFYRGKGGLALSPELEAARDLGVIGSSLTAADIPDAKDLPIYNRFYEQPGKIGALVSLPGKGYDKLKKLNEYRESVGRYAAFLHYKSKLDAGEQVHYGGAKKSVVDALQKEHGNDVAAAHLARNLLGDYDNLTVSGSWMRQHLMPFYSWMEVNAKRWPRLGENAMRDGAASFARAGLTKGVFFTATSLAKLGAFTAAVYTWNNTVAADEEKDLSPDQKASLHITIPAWMGGRRKDGSVRVLNRVGALADFLDWFGLTELVANKDKLAEGQMTPGDVAAEMAKAPVNKAAQAVRPDIKTGTELLIGRSTFPDVFNPKPADRGQIAAGVVGFQDELKEGRGRMGTGERATPGYWDKIMFGLANVKPERSAVSEIRDLREAYEKKNGYKRPESLPPSKTIIMRQAADQDDFEAFRQAKKVFLENKGTAEGFYQSIKHIDPTEGVKNPESFQKFLNDDQKKKLAVAKKYAQDQQGKLRKWWAEAKD